MSEISPKCVLGKMVSKKFQKTHRRYLRFSLRKQFHRKCYPDNFAKFIRKAVLKRIFMNEWQKQSP